MVPTSPLFYGVYTDSAIIRLFIVDGIISLPIALLGYFILPDIPEIAKPFYLTKEVRFKITSLCILS